ncbi:MAG: peptide methionine sulfoxide reductase [Phycisphaerales bacterium]|nr:peptide methionine sulfoxide reductase [Phycisphaerales bacterium]
MTAHPKRHLFPGVFIMALSSILGMACTLPTHAAADLPKSATDLPKPRDNADQTIIVAGGCFWCTEASLEILNGVKDVVSGYSGGEKETANYEAVCTGRTGHAEAIRITYDPSKITYGELLRAFFTAHNPTTKNQQGADRGTQYRSAIFYQSDEEKKVAEAYIKQLNDAKAFDKPIVTTVEKFNAFYPAEDYHQNYARAHPTDGYIVNVALPHVKKVMDHFKDELKKDEEKK